MGHAVEIHVDRHLLACPKRIQNASTTGWDSPAVAPSAGIVVVRAGEGGKAPPPKPVSNRIAATRRSGESGRERPSARLSSGLVRCGHVAPDLAAEYGLTLSRDQYLGSLYRPCELGNIFVELAWLCGLLRLAASSVPLAVIAQPPATQHQHGTTTVRHTNSRIRPGPGLLTSTDNTSLSPAQPASSAPMSSTSCSAGASESVAQPGPLLRARP